MMKPVRTLLLTAAVMPFGLAALPLPLRAQQVEVPFDTYCPPDAQAACFSTAEVMGLDPNGDGFLAVRTGPGTGYRMIAKIHNGDRVETYGGRGKWVAISFGPSGRLGWVHGNWLGNYIP